MAIYIEATGLRARERKRKPGPRRVKMKERDMPSKWKCGADRAKDRER